MSESINIRIIKKINQSNFNNNIKLLLKNLLALELENIETGTKVYANSYDRLIEMYLEEDK